MVESPSSIRARGVIDANASGTGISTELTLNGSGITNSGLLEATNGNTLIDPDRHRERRRKHHGERNEQYRQPG
jgi:hypothetical protein